MNIPKLASEGMPASGKKPHSRMKSAQKSTKRIAGILDDACEDDHIHRTAPCSVSFTQNNFPPPLLHAPL